MVTFSPRNWKQATMKKFTFSGHDSFVLRHGWLKKIYDRLNELEVGHGQEGEAIVPCAEMFEHEQAMSAFGVGKNMVRAMRYWAFATNFFTLTKEGNIKATELGDLILGDSANERGFGLDPYFENPATLWLAHWEIATNDHLCTAWDFAFSIFNRTIFTKETLVSGLISEVDEREWVVSPGSIEKDISCILHMYCPDRKTSKGAFREEGLESPLAELGLIWKDLATGGYRFEVGPKPSLDPRVLYYAIARYAEGRKSKLLSLDESFYDHGAPGRVFKLDENSMCSLLEMAASKTNGALEWQETGPLRQLKISEDLKEPLELLRDIYAKTEKIVA
jgi:hypothetical protein